MPYRGRNIAVERVHAALTAGAPEQRIERKAHCSCDAVTSARRLGNGIGKDDRFRVDKRAQPVILPERIDFGHIGNVEGRLLEAQEIGQDLHPVEQRIDVPMDMPFGRALRTSADH